MINRHNSPPDNPLRRTWLINCQFQQRKFCPRERPATLLQPVGQVMFTGRQFSNSANSTPLLVSRSLANRAIAASLCPSTKRLENYHVPPNNGWALRSHLAMWRESFSDAGERHMGIFRCVDGQRHFRASPHLHFESRIRGRRNPGLPKNKMGTKGQTNATSILLLCNCISCFYWLFTRHPFHSCPIIFDRIPASTIYELIVLASTKSLLVAVEFTKAPYFFVVLETFLRVKLNNTIYSGKKST
jgi:hypothetical protein